MSAGNAAAGDLRAAAAGTVHQLPTDAQLRAEFTADPNLIERLRADRDRIGLQASTAARFVADRIRSRFKSAAKDLPLKIAHEAGTASHTAAIVAEARHLLEEIACLHAARDGAPHLTDVRSLSRHGAETMRRAMEGKASVVQQRNNDRADLDRLSAKQKR